MERKYIIQRVSKPLKENTWDLLPKAEIDHYLWEKNGYEPRAEVAVCYSDTGLHIQFTTWENNITVRNLSENSPVYEDSCVEFFLNPMPEKDTRYMNFETNAAGKLLLGMGSGRSDWRLLDKADHSLFGVRSSVPGNGYDSFAGPSWTIEYTIPFEFIKEYYTGFQPKAGKLIKGNFYKCGDKTSYPHYGCWALIDSAVADFHAPHFFGSLLLE